MKNNPDLVLENKDFLSKKNYLWSEAVLAYVDNFLLGKFASEKNYNDVSLLKFAISKMEETIKYESNYPARFFTLGKLYGVLALASPGENDELLLKAEEQFKKALSLYKDKQDIAYMYAVNLSNQGRDDEALAITKREVDLDPRVLESHYYYAIMLIKKGGVKNTDLSLSEFEIAFNGGFGPKDELPKEVYNKLLLYYYENKDIHRLSTVLSRLIVLNPAQAQIYQKIVDYIKQNKVIPILSM